ncbi:chromosome segregation protein Spc25-domain-containing protein [Phlyctochytrium arcticum]|nr:chromosome segregation protein Spc25-domain-containing protein [Phlyctochytrium arcticum]
MVYGQDVATVSLAKNLSRLSLGPNAVPHPEPPAAKAPSIPTSIDAHLNDLNDECSAFLDRFNVWAATKKKEIEEGRMAYLQTLEEFQARQTQLESQIEALKIKELENEQVFEREKREATEMENEVNELKVQKDEREFARGELLDNVSRMQSDLRRRREDLALKREARRTQHQRLQPELECYEQKLAVQIIGLQNEILKFIFTHVNPADWDQEYSFVIDVRRQDYQVIDCNPPLPILDGLVEWLNSTRDFSTFLKMMRRGFATIAKI